MSNLKPPELPLRSQAPTLRLLLAEDCQAMRLTLRAELERLGRVRVIAEAANSHEALDLFFRLLPDAVLVSVRLPPQGGFEVLQRVKEAASDCFVILTTSSPNAFVEKTGRLLGATAVWPSSEDTKRIGEILLQWQASRQVGSD